MAQEKLDIYIPKKKKKWSLDTDLTPFSKVNSKWIIDLNVKWKTIKFLEDNQGENLDDLGYGDAFLDTTTKAQFLAEIVDKLDFINQIFLLCERQYQEN